MGTFLGHALAGVSAVVFGVWCSYAILRRYYEARLMRQRFKSSASFLFPFAPNIPLEAFAKLFLLSGGILLEALTGIEKGSFVHPMIPHHMFLYAFASINPIIDILIFYKFPFMIPDADYMTGLAVGLVEAFLFSWHMQPNTSLMDHRVHTFLLYSIILSISGGFLEICYRHNIWAALVRCCGIIMQGTWLCHIGFILYNPLGPSWLDSSRHEDLSLVTMKFVWHFAGSIVWILLLAVFLHRKVNKEASSSFSSFSTHKPSVRSPNLTKWHSIESLVGDRCEEDQEDCH